MIDETETATANRKTRRAWLMIVGVFSLFLGGLLFLAFHDDPPPDDSWILPHMKKVSNPRQNPLAQFCKFVEGHPYSQPDFFKGGFDKIRTTDLSRLRGYLDENKERIAAFDRLMISDSSTWGWPDIDDQVSIENSFGGYLDGCMTILCDVQRVRVEVQARRGNVLEATEEALKALRYSSGLCDTQECLIHWLVASTCLRITGDFFERALTSGNANDELLKRVQDVLSKTDPKPRQLGSALQWDYVFGKNSENNPRALAAMAMLMDEKDMFFIRHFYMPNQSRTIQLQEERSLLDATHRRWPEVVAESMKLKARLSTWGDKMFLMKFNPNAGGYLCLHRSLSYIPRMVEASIRDCALHRQIGIIVALRRYELRHGRLPAKMNDLCPEYLPAIPNDPLDGAPMRSDLAAGKIYSVGTDMKDDLGSFGPPPRRGERVRSDKDFGRFYWWPKAAASP